MSFKTDLSQAKKTENEIALFLCDKFNYKIHSTCNNKECDFSLVNSNGVIKKFEVKEDFKALQTKNIAIEYECRKRPSGISTSLADFFIYKIGFELFLISIQNLKELARKGKKSIGGDLNSNTKLMLVSLKRFKRIAKNLTSNCVATKKAGI